MKRLRLMTRYIPLSGPKSSQNNTSIGNLFLSVSYIIIHKIVTHRCVDIKSSHGSSWLSILGHVTLFYCNSFMTALLHRELLLCSKVGVHVPVLVHGTDICAVVPIVQQLTQKMFLLRIMLGASETTWRIHNGALIFGSGCRNSFFHRKWLYRR